jgi:hypothetical protein
MLTTLGLEPASPVKRTILLLSTLSLLQSLLVCFVLTRRFPNSGDEHSYLFQARLFATGRLYGVDSLYDREQPLNRYIAAFCLTDFHGKRFSEYQPGWPMILALGVRAGVEWFVAPLLGATLVFLMLSYIARRLGPDLVVPGWLLLFLCAFFSFNNASLRAHTLTAVCVFATYVIFESRAQNSQSTSLRVFAAGAVLGFSALVRYIDWIPLGGWIAWRLLQQRRWRDLLLLGIGFTLPASGNLVYDSLLSGNPFVTPTALYGAPGWHNRLVVSWMGIVVTLARVWKLLYAFPPVLLLGLLWRRFPASPRLRVHLGLFLANLAIYFFYPAAVGGPGPRYLLAYFPFLVLAVVEVYRFIRDEGSPVTWRLWRFALGGQVVCSLIFASIETHLVSERLDLERSVEKLGGDQKIVLLKTGANDMDLGDLLRNPPVLSSADTLYLAWDDGGPGLRELLARFPGRKVYTYQYSGIVHALDDDPEARVLMPKAVDRSHRPPVSP